MINPAMLEKKKQMHRFLIETYTVTSCLNCLYFDKAKDQCGKWDMKPPTTVAVYGCPDYETDIPF